ncbi:hypothetical protein ACFTWH_08440 [Streptomyces sp. NPDC057011]|uniref:hypothetical protein n=1 Tax=unclassified Streptomyces TaxID=2593676 RepID=UPI0036447FF2
MTVMIENPSTGNTARSRDPKELLNAVTPHIQHLTVNILDDGMTVWDREIALLLRDEVDTRETAERILGNAVMYMIASMENPDVHIGVGKIVDKGVHQVILDTPVYFAFCDLYNGGKYKHHAPFIKRRTDGLVIRTADFLTSCGFSPDQELWAKDGADCSPCDSKVPDSH